MGVQNTTIYPQIKQYLNIPDDEPIFILRAQDILSLPTLRHYTDQASEEGADPSFLENLRQAGNTFEDWRIKNSGRVKFPD